MSVSLYRGQVDRLTSELAQLEEKVAGERGRAAKERADGLRASQSITKTTSASAAQSKLREVQRHEERAVGHDRQAAHYATQSATKRRAMSEAQGRLQQAEASERKKVAGEADRRRRDDQRQLNEIDRARRAMAQGADRTASVSVPPVRVATAAPAEAIDATTRPLAGAKDGATSDLERSIVRLPAETTVDAALEMSKAAALGALGLVPLIGPMLRELVGAAWGDNRADRLERFATELGRNVEALWDRLDRDFVRREEFGALAEESLERVVQRRNEPKISKFAAAVAHAATTERPDVRARERYLDWLDQLRPIHLEILGRLAAGTAAWVRPADVFTVGQVASSRIAHALDGLACDRLDLDELERRGLIGSLDDSATLLGVAADVRALLTVPGREFLAFVTMGGRTGPGSSGQR